MLLIQYRSVLWVKKINFLIILKFLCNYKIGVVMKVKIFLAASAFLAALNVAAATECSEKISSYFIGTGQVNQAHAHLWINFQGGGSASVSSQSAAFDGMLSTVVTSIVTDKSVKVRYFSDGAACKSHHDDWVGLRLYK